MLTPLVLPVLWMLSLLVSYVLLLLLSFMYPVLLRSVSHCHCISGVVGVTMPVVVACVGDSVCICTLF